MALGDPIQWIIIGVIVIVIFLWGPQKIPDIARALGRAKREFDDASREVRNATSVTTAMAGTTTLKPAAEMTGDEVLIDTAKRLGISTEGKSREQISQEIVNRTKPQQ